jgi:hypothetical protein
MKTTTLTTLAPAALLLGAGVLAACGDSDEATPPVTESTSFQVRVKNTATPYRYLKSGAFDTPVGENAPGALLPGAAYEASFTAPPGARLSFATMFVHSNDLFYAPSPEGLALFADDGTPRTGDVTSAIMLWDAGTEIDQEPGLGVDQAPRQAGPGAGEIDPMGTVRLAEQTLPAPNQVVQVTLSHDGEDSFTLRIMNVSDDDTLTLSDGSSTAAPLAPGVWVVHSEPAPLFSAGQADSGMGLEALAEDGNPSVLAAALTEETGLATPLAPGAWAVHGSETNLFSDGSNDRGEGLEALAEDGDPSVLADHLATADGVRTSGAFTTPEGQSSAAPIGPGGEYVFTIEAKPGDRLSFATMFVQSNDLFYAPDPAGIALFSSEGTPISGDISDQLRLWDAGTELNQEPGIGSKQAPRQSGPNTGDEESAAVRRVDDDYAYPSETIQVTITPK